MILLKSILDFFFPRYCLICNSPLEPDEDPICVHCNLRLPRSFLWKDAKENHLAKRFYGKAFLEKAASYIYFYPHTNTANIIYTFKYDNAPYVAYMMGEYMGQEISLTDFFDDIDCLIPVPLNKKRIAERGYNQSERLASGICKTTGIPVIDNAITRKRYTISQTTMDAFERQENMKDVFELTKNAHILQGKHCLLIDDVITTGATTAACARALSSIPDIKLSVLSFACVKNEK